VARVRVGIDAQLARGTATGIGEYIVGLLAALREHDELEIVPLDAPGFDPWRFDRRVAWDQVGLPLAVRRARIDLLHCTAGTMPLIAPVPIVATVHDVAWLRVQQHTRAYARAYFGRLALARYRHARCIMVDSSFSRTELLELGGIDSARVAAVFPGVSPDFGALARRPDAAPFGLVVGTVERRKNLEIAIRALAGSGELRLVSVGPATPYREHCERIAHDTGTAGRVEFRGYVSRAELLDLYARATFVALPSRYEGFGYPAAQALCAGVPLLAAATSSLPEVVGDAAPLLPPDDVAAWDAAFRAIVDDRDAAEARAQAVKPAANLRFAWRTAADAIVRQYARALVDH
jgi:glycosyltransferase involved in cell wall biosynthesis